MKDRQIYLGGRWSGDDLGVEILAGGFGDPPPRILKETVAGMNGSYNFSNIDGELHYDDRKGSYTFCIRGRDAKDASNIKAAVMDWLYSGTVLYDENIDGYIYTDVCCTGVDEPRIIGDGRRIIQLTANFTAAPFMRSRTGRLIDCTTFTPNSNNTIYVYDMYATVSPLMAATGFLARMGTAIGGSFITPSSIETTLSYADVPISNSPYTRWWLGFPKTYNSNQFAVAAVSDCNVIESDNYWIIRALGTDITVRISGSVQGDGCKIAALNATWLKSDGSAKSWLNSTIPSTNDMRIISEGDPVITINGVAANVSHFALAAGDLLTVTGAKSEPCKLQYCTVKERR